jgi:hypothetical protein
MVKKKNIKFKNSWSMPKRTEIHIELERALTNVQRYCTDGKLTSEWQEKVADKESKVRERMEELRHAQASGDPEKIYKKPKMSLWKYKLASINH